MDKLSYKKEVLEQARRRQREIINDFRTRIDEISMSEAHLNEDQYDQDQKSMNESGIALIDRLADELNFAAEELGLLERMKVGDHIHESVSLGSVVETDQRTFFPCVSIEKFQVGDRELFGISEKAPLYAEMKDKKIGERFGYNGEEYVIRDVY